MGEEPDTPGPAEKALMEDETLRARLRELDDALKRKRAEGAQDRAVAAEPPGAPEADS